MSKNLLGSLRANTGLRAVNVLRIASAVAALETVTIGADVYEVDVGAGVTAGRLAIDLTAAGTKAVGTLTFAAAVSNNETVTIQGRVYTYKTTLTGAADEVLIGANQTASRDNLVAAIMAAAGAGTTYGTGTVVNAHVTAVASSTNMVVTAKITGLGGNAYTTTETLAGASNAWGGATLASAADPTAAQAITALVLAINTKATEQVSSVAISTVAVLLFSKKATALTLACTETLAGANNAWAAAAMYGGASKSGLSGVTGSRVPNAVEVAIGFMCFAYPFAVGAVLPNVRVTSSGAAKAWDGNTTFTGNVVTLDNAGSTDWAATDTVTVHTSA